MRFRKTFSLILGIITAAGLSVSAASAAAEPAVVTESVTRRSLSAGDTYTKGGLLYTELDDGTYEVGYDYNGEKPGSSVTIPQTVNGKTVTRIAESGFYRCHDLESIKLPKTVVSAGENAFTGTKLVSDQSDNTIRYAGHLAVECSTTATYATVKDGTLGLSDKLFALSPNIEEVELPDTLVNLGSNTFAGCSKLEDVNIPNGITEIKDGVFYGCEDLDVFLPKSLKSIGAYAFANSGITGVKIPNVTKIGKGAFENSAVWRNVYVSDSYIETGARAFAGTPYYDSLGDVKYIGNICIGAESDVTSVKLREGTLGIADMAFTECESLKSITIPGSVKDIGDDAFFNCTGLTTVTIGNGAESIGKDAFRLCSKLSEVSLPKSLKAVYNGAFYGCNKLASVKYAGSMIDWAGIAFGDDNERLSSAQITFAEEPKALAAVGDLKVTKTTSDRISFSWKQSAGALIYEIYQKNGSSWKKIDELAGDSTFYTVDNLSQNTEYTFRVKAKTGQFSTSAEVTAKTLFDAPDAVTNLTAAPGMYNVKLSWNKSETADRYQVEILKNGKWTSLSSTVTSTSYDVTGLSALTEYKFRVFAFRGSNYSKSATVTATTLTDVPDAVTNLTAAPGINNVKLSWNKSSIADRYQVEILKNGKWTSLSSTVTSTSYNVTGLSALTEYKFRVFAFRGSKYSRSATVTATTLTDVPDAVTNLTAAPGSFNVNLSWNKSAIADRYQVEILKNGKWTVVSSTVTSTSYNVTELSGLTEYKFRVFAFRGSKYSKSATVTATTLTDVPDAVTNLTAAPGAFNVKLSWNKSAIADRYQVEILKNGKWTVVSSNVTSTSYNVTGLSGLTEYKFRVFAFRGSKYSKSATVTATTLTDVPDAVTNLTAAPGSFNVNLSWNKSAIADRYQVEILKNGKWTVVSSTVTSTSYNVTGLSGLTEYKFRVFAFRGSKYSRSATVTATTLTDVPDAVTNLTATPGINNVDLSWNKSAIADRYQVEILKNGKWTVVSSAVTSTSYNVTELSGLTEYKFRVFAFRGSKYSKSATVTATTLTDIPDAVTNISANSVDTTKFTLKWNKSAIADNYRVEMLSGGTWKQLAQTSSLFYNVTSLMPNTEYRFRVTAIRGTKAGAGTTLVMKTDSKRPDPIVGLEAISKPTSVKLLWDKSLLADSYQVEMLKNNVWVSIAKTTATSYNVTGLSESTSYEFRVRAYNYVEYSASVRIGVITKKSLAPILDLSLQYGDLRMMMKGIDVSGYQGTIDFNAVKKSGVDFVIIKAGYSTSTVDTWETNYKNAKKAGLKVGAYWFSYATTLSEGKSEAKAFIRAMNGKQLDFPVYFDIENSEQFNKGMTFCTNLVNTFCGQVEDAGYLAGVYCSRYWYTNYVAENVRLSRPTWIADYNRACDYGGSYGIWQYGIGAVSGINGKCDLNWAYTDYSSFIKRNGLNGY